MFRNNKCHVTSHICYVSTVSTEKQHHTKQTGRLVSFRDAYFTCHPQQPPRGQVSLFMHPIRSSHSHANYHFFHLTSPLLNSLSNLLPSLQEAPLYRVTSWTIESILFIQTFKFLLFAGTVRGPGHAQIRCSPWPLKAHNHDNREDSCKLLIYMQRFNCPSFRPHSLSLEQC